VCEPARDEAISAAIAGKSASIKGLATYTNFANNTDHCGSGLAREGGGIVNIDVA
jgi:hypothetical protein